MHLVRRDLGQRSEHVRTLEQVRTRHGVVLGLLDARTEQQDVEIHAARRPLRRVARSAAMDFDRSQPRDHGIDRQRGAKAHHHVDELGALEAHGLVAKAARKDRAGPRVRHCFAGARQILLWLYVAARRDPDARHFFGRSARVRNTATPTSLLWRIAPGLFTESRTHSTPNSSSTMSAARCASVSTSLNSDFSTNE